MYKGYSLRIDENYFDDYYRMGNEIHSKNNNIAREGLNSFFDDDGSLFASKIIDAWFPKIEASVFISHSHKDARMAISFAGWLWHKFKIKSFVDSCVWGYSDEILKKIDDKYCVKKSGSYSYEKRNITTSHVNMMLATSLTKMIDQCECIIFLNTPNSISCKGCVENDGTESPWIYSEIQITKVIEKKLERKTLVRKSAEAYAIQNEDFKIKYDVNLKHLFKLAVQQILMLENSKKMGADALDFLYKTSD